MQTDQKEKWSKRPEIALALISLLLCGLFFPLLMTSLAQVIFPNQANGDIVKLKGQPVGSNLIAQNFSLPIFFHSRDPSQSASGVDPDITLQDAYSQTNRIQNATGIPSDALTNLINENKEGTVWIFGTPYLNVLRINLALIQTYPSIYSQFQ
jgi:K+-transporting ATPase ATPase C chain